jgi:hypothetical protein
MIKLPASTSMELTRRLNQSGSNTLESIPNADRWPQCSETR